MSSSNSMFISRSPGPDICCQIDRLMIILRACKPIMPHLPTSLLELYYNKSPWSHMALVVPAGRIQRQIEPVTQDAARTLRRKLRRAFVQLLPRTMTVSVTI